MNQSRPATTAILRCGLYIHVPFCETKCGYCDFFSVALKGRNPVPLVDRLIRELEWRTTDVEGICTVFVGGGTPTLLPTDLLTRLLDAVGRRVRIGDLEEFTVEANPATIDDAKAKLLVGAGVTRVSMGAQSFHPGELATLERLHCPSDIAPSVATLRRSGIRQVNLDLIFGIPGQTMQTWLDSLRRAIDLSPDHIACYGLTYEPATRLTALKVGGRLTPCDEDLEAQMFLATMDTLESAGYRQYEISNYAKPGCESRHNLMYWRNEPYIGVGPSAAGCIPATGSTTSSSAKTAQRLVPLAVSQGPPHLGDAEGDLVSGGIENDRTCPVVRRYKNVSDIAGYVRMMDLQGHAEAESEVIDGDTLMLEMILMQLRLNEGLSVAAFERRTGLNPLDVFAEAVHCLREQRLISADSTSIALTHSGRLVADRVIKDMATALHCGGD